MAQRFIALTEADYALFMRMLDWWKKQTGSSLPKELPKPSQAPERYVAKTPTGGISARVSVTPGSAPCDIYKINDAEELEAVDDFNKTVYNLALIAVGGDVYINVARDKYGRWVAETGCQESGTGTCGPTISGIELGDLRIVTPADVSYLICQAGNCLARVPKSNCP